MTVPTRVRDDIELIIENVGGGGGGKPPNPRGGGDRGGDGGRRVPASARRYYTGIAVAIVSILMFFMALVSAYVVRKGASPDWVSFHFPRLIWINTAVLLASSLTMELARRRLLASESAAFRAWWSVTTVLGVLFLVGQLVVWRELVAQGVYVASSPASSFFYIFTGAHAVHLLGGVGALLFVAFRNFERAKVSALTAVAVTARYWHFLDALWIFLAVLLYFGR
jgi:cytochrome c oxidase subunit 3